MYIPLRFQRNVNMHIFAYLTVISVYLYSFSAFLNEILQIYAENHVIEYVFCIKMTNFATRTNHTYIRKWHTHA